MRAPIKVDVIRDRNAMARIVDNGIVENVYRLQMMNATERDGTYRISVSGLPGLTVASSDEARIKAAQSQMLAVRVRVDPKDLAAGSKPIVFTISDLGHKIEIHEKSTFVLPR